MQRATGSNYSNELMNLLQRHERLTVGSPAPD
jgi:hypothetical protein